MGSCNELSWVLTCPVLYCHIHKTTLYGFMRILWCKGLCLKLKITRSPKPGSAILEQAQCICVQKPHRVWSSPNWTLHLNAKKTTKIPLLVDVQLLVTKWVFNRFVTLSLGEELILKKFFLLSNLSSPSGFIQVFNVQHWLWFLKLHSCIFCQLFLNPCTVEGRLRAGIF